MRRYLPPVHALRLLRWILLQEWQQPHHGQRIVRGRLLQHYGFDSEYCGGQIIAQRPSAPFSGILSHCIETLHAVQPSVGPMPNQVLVSAYGPGQGIGLHVDRTDLFGGVVSCLSLLGQAKLRLHDYPTQQTDSPPAATVRMLEHGSLYCLASSARYRWKHGIASSRREKKRSPLDLPRQLDLARQWAKDSLCAACVPCTCLDAPAIPCRAQHDAQAQSPECNCLEQVRGLLPGVRIAITLRRVEDHHGVSAQVVSNIKARLETLGLGRAPASQLR